MRKYHPPSGRRRQQEDKTGTEFAESIRVIDKIAFSRSTERAYSNTRVVSTDPAEELLRLKQMPGKKVSVATISLLPQLIEKGIIDEYYLLVFPVIVGHGPYRLEDGTLAENEN